MRKRILSLISVVVLVFVLLATLAGCQSKLTNEEALDALNQAIEKTIASDTFLVKEKTKLTGASYRTVWLNQHAKSEDSKYDNTALEFVDTTITDIAGTIGSRDKYLFGASISKDIKKPNKADPSEFKQYLFQYNYDTSKKADNLLNKGEKTYDDVVAIDAIKSYMPENILKDIMGFNLDNVEILSAVVQGKVTTIQLIVKQEGNKYAAYSEKGIEIALLYDKVYKIATLDSNETYRIDITSYGPNISIPKYDA